MLGRFSNVMLTIGKYWCRRPDLGIISTLDEEGGSERTLPPPYNVAAACFYMLLFLFQRVSISVSCSG